MTLGEITVSYHAGYERQKPALKITPFTPTRLLIRPFFLSSPFCWYCPCSVLAHRKNDMKYESESNKKKKIFFL